MKINYCLPIIKQSKQDVIDMIKANPDYDYYEVWLDYIDDLDEEYVNVLFKDFGPKLVLLFRRQNLEPIRTIQDTRFRIYELARGKDILVDFDIASQRDDLERLNHTSSELKTILSYHNYELTPNTEELNTIISEMEAYNPHIFKIATRCTNEQDSLKLLDILLKLRQSGKQYIVLGMGEYGMITRVFGTIWGNEMLFAPKTTEEASAPGQLTKSEYEEIFKSLH